MRGRERERERERERRRKSLFDWPVAFTKVKLMVANCALAVFRGACKSYEIAIVYGCAVFQKPEDPANSVSLLRF